MAKVSNVIYCLNTKDTENKGTLNANGVISAITPEFVPGGFSFAIIVTILDMKPTDCQFDLQFISPDEEILVNVENISVPPNPNEDNLPDEYRGINLAIDLQNVVFKKSGLYRTKVKFKNNTFEEYPIFVKGKNEK